MTIEEAKKDLEQQIILWDGVNGVGIIKDAGHGVIEVAVEGGNEAILQKINQLIPENQWKGHKVKVIPTNNFKLH